MTDYKAMIEEHSCKPNQGCGVMTICMCGVAEDMADEIERLREALREYVATVVCEEGVAFIDRMPTAELRLLVESVSKEDK